MASGTPLVVPNAGGVLEYADTSCAWLAQPEGEAFARAVLGVLSNPEGARAKVEKARLVAERHNWRKVTEQFFDTYEAFHAVRAIAGQRGEVPIKGPSFVASENRGNVDLGVEGCFLSADAQHEPCRFS
jgi:hypothetical protein